MTTLSKQSVRPATCRPSRSVGPITLGAGATWDGENAERLARSPRRQISAAANAHRASGLPILAAARAPWPGATFYHMAHQLIFGIVA